MSGSNKAFLNYTKFVLVMVFLVILAGGVVRMTQSGMGCPDWPKCFGTWIPPLNESQLPPDFESYLDKQDIDHSFNVYHTWIEYINRLLGALLGIFVFIELIWAFVRFRKTDMKIVFAAIGLFLITGVQGFLGKMVVDANLDVVKITLHMLIALVIAAIPAYIIHRLRGSSLVAPKKIRNVVVFTLVIMIIQIILGTQVREEIDAISKELLYKERGLWIGKTGFIFIVHRSFSWLVLLSTGYLVYLCKNIDHLKNYAFTVLGVVGTTVLAGVAMNYLGMPAIAQPVHLLLAAVLTTLLFYILVRIVTVKK